MGYQKLQSVLIEMGFNCVEVDSSIYVYSKDKVQIILLVFVDDITLASNSIEAIHSVIKASHF
jgi:hypothetical protein